MTGAQLPTLQIEFVGFSAHANGEVAILALVLIAVAFMFRRAMRRF